MWTSKKPSLSIFYLLGAIIVLAFILRIYKITQIPVSLYWDEVAIGYNAYSISQTGKDEYDIWQPILFRSFDDYKLPGAIYFTAIFTSFFGLNEWSARLPAVTASIATVIVTFFLTQEILKRTWFTKNATQLSLLTSLLFAISPWHLQFSRANFEAVSGLSVALLGFYFLFRGLRSAYMFLWGCITLAVSLYFYRSLLIVVPLLSICFLLQFRKDLVRFSKKFLLGSLFLILLIVFPLFKELTSVEGMLRYSQVTIFANDNPAVKKIVEERAAKPDTLFNRIRYNHRLGYLQTFFHNYVLNFNPEYLFISTGGDSRHGTMSTGLMYIWEAPFFLIGVWLLVKTKTQTARFLLAWFLLSPLPSALTFPSPHSLRTLHMLPLPQILTALGIKTFLLTQKPALRPFVFSGLSFLCALSLMIYLNYYYTSWTKNSNKEWADGYKQVTNAVFARESQYEKVIISGHYWKPYIYFLFYASYPPQLYQLVGTSSHFANYDFAGSPWGIGEKDLRFVDFTSRYDTPNVLIVAALAEYQSLKNNYCKLKEIKNVNNEVVFVLAEYAKPNVCCVR